MGWWGCHPAIALRRHRDPGDAQCPHPVMPAPHPPAPHPPQAHLVDKMPVSLSSKWMVPSWWVCGSGRWTWRVCARVCVCVRACASPVLSRSHITSLCT